MGCGESRGKGYLHMTCAHCGTENQVGAAFCRNCGTNLAASSTVMPPTQAIPPPPIAVAPFQINLGGISGPDQGKIITVGPREVTLGTSPPANVLSNDPDVVADHAGFIADQGWLHFRTRSLGQIWANGTAQPIGAIAPGQQIQIGRSLWQAQPVPVPHPYAAGGHAAVARAESLFDTLGRHVSALAGVEALEGFQAKETFSTVLAAHSDEEIEEYFLSGTRTTTPLLSEVKAAWPKPWLFFKVYTVSLVIYLAFVFGLLYFKNANFLPGLIIIGAFGIPLSVLFFYFEMNVPRNVSLYQVLKMLLIGGITSLIAAMFGYTYLPVTNILGASGAGIIEELAKTAALLIVVNNWRYPWTLNGLLFGGAIGAGFAGFETAGYALQALIKTQDIAPILPTLFFRGILAPGGHVAWAALEGAALWKVKGDRPFSLNMLGDIRFLRVFALCMVLHMMWDFSLGGLIDLVKDALLTLVAVSAVLAYIQDGLKQVQTAQTAAQSAPISAHG